MYTLFMASSLDLLLFFFLETSLDDVLRRTDLWAEPSADGLDLVEFDKENMHLCEKLIRTDTFACNTVSDFKNTDSIWVRTCCIILLCCGLT